MSKQADFWSMVRLVARQEAQHARDGGPREAMDAYCVPGSWNPTDGTVAVITEDAIALIQSGTEVPDPTMRVEIHAPVHGMQAGPEGGERIILHRRQSGWIGTIEHGPDDSPQVPAGEVAISKSFGAFRMRKANNGTIEVATTKVRLGPDNAAQYAVIRVSDLNALVSQVNALVSQLNTHRHGPGDGTNTGMPLLAFSNVTTQPGSPNVTAT